MQQLQPMNQQPAAAEAPVIAAFKRLEGEINMLATLVDTAWVKCKPVMCSKPRAETPPKPVPVHGTSDLTAALSERANTVAHLNERLQELLQDLEI